MAATNQTEALKERKKSLECQKQDIRRNVKARDDKRFKEAGGCNTCSGRGWIVIWDTLDSMSGCYAEYADCSNESCTHETRERSGLKCPEPDRLRPEPVPSAPARPRWPPPTRHPPVTDGDGDSTRSAGPASQLNSPKRPLLDVQLSLAVRKRSATSLHQLRPHATQNPHVPRVRPAPRPDQRPWWRCRAATGR